MPSRFQPAFTRLRGILEKHAAAFAIAKDTSDHFSLEAPAGPATIRAWGGKVRRPRIPVAWVQIGKAYVSYHLMGIDGNPKLLERSSQKLRAHMQGKSCFNFKTLDDELLDELELLTAESLAGMKKAGYIS